MSRTEKIGKLARAAREWRGKWDIKTGKWFQSPKPTALPRVKRWAVELGLSEDATVARIASFKYLQDFEEWLKTL